MIGYIAVGVIWFAIGWLIREQYAKYKVKQFQKDDVTSILDSVVTIEIKKMDECFYSYNTDTGDFLAQGKTQDELADNLIKRFPDRIFITKASIWDNIK